MMSVRVFLILFLVSRIHAQCTNDGDVRLAGGPNQFEGRVEYCLNSNWKQVCSMGWTSPDAQVVCRQLGFNRSSTPVPNDILHGDANDLLGITNVKCNGDEQKLNECSLVTLGDSSTCSGYSGPAGVVCQDPLCVSDSTSVRLSEDQVVEVCADNSGYRTGVCSNNWDDIDASVVCRQLGLGERGVALSTNPSVYQLRLAYQNVSCAGTEEKLSNCTHGTITSTYPLNQCSTGRFAQVQCEGVSTTGNITVIATTTIPPVEATTELTTHSTTTGSDDLDTTTDIKLNPTTGASITPEETSEPGSAQLNQSNSLLAIVLGAVGGLIALLLFGIVVLLVVIVLGRRRRKYSLQYLDNSANGQVVMATTQVKSVEDSQLVNSYTSHKGDPERLLLNPLYLYNQHQMANTNPLPYSSVLTPPSTAGSGGDSQLHEYATLDNFQSTISQWPPSQPQEYSAPVTPSPVNGDVSPRAPSTEAANAYSEPGNDGNFKVGEDGIVTDLQGYASLDPTAHTYDFPQLNGAAVSGAGEEDVVTLHVPQPYECPLESSYEDASSTNISRASTPLSARSVRESPERIEAAGQANSNTPLHGEGKINPYMTPSPLPAIEVPGSHNYATLESPK